MRDRPDSSSRIAALRERGSDAESEGNSSVVPAVQVIQPMFDGSSRIERRVVSDIDVMVPHAPSDIPDRVLGGRHRCRDDSAPETLGTSIARKDFESVRTVVGGWVPDGGQLRRWDQQAPASAGSPPARITRGSAPSSLWSQGSSGIGAAADIAGDSGGRIAQNDPEVGCVDVVSSDAGEIDDTSDNGPHDPETDDQDDLGAHSSPRRTRLGARRLSRPFARLAEIWVPEPLRDARVDPGRRGLIVLLLVAALAAVATAVGVWRDRPEPRPVESSAIVALAVSSPPATPAGAADQIAATPAVAQGGAAGASTADSPSEMVVSVTGLVAHPGVVTLGAGSRVADAIAAAGGAAAEADLTGLNLAARLVDGDSVVVGGPPAGGGLASGVSADGAGSGATAGSGPAGGLIDLNTADESALDTLPGVGPVMAQNILAWRETNGRFTNVEQLQEISGIGPSRYAQISPLVTVP